MSPPLTPCLFNSLFGVLIIRSLEPNHGVSVYGVR